jgi:phosphoglycolate phosphatase-like HAD superfamily hydrolase
LSGVCAPSTKDSEVGPIDGAKEAFQKLRAAGVRVALDTGFSRPITEIILKRFAWGKTRLTPLFAPTRWKNGRPYPDMIFALMKHFGITDTALVAKVGDTPSDLEEEQAQGAAPLSG